MILFFDLETHPIERAQLAPRPVSASWAFDDGPPCAGLITDFLPVLCAALEGSTVMVGQNTAYDFACMAARWPALLEAIFAKYVRGEVRDISIDQKIIDIAVNGRTEFGYALDALCERHGLPEVNKSSVWRMEFASLENVPYENWPAGAKEYVLADADRPAKIFAKQAAIAAAWLERYGRPLLHLSGQEAYKAFAFHLMSCKGFYADRERALALKVTIAKALDAVRGLLQAEGLVRKDGSRNTKAAAARVERVFGELGIQVARTKGKAVSLSKDVLEGVPDEVLVAYSIYSQASTYQGRADDLCQGFELPLQVRVNSLLETSRTSTSKPGPPLVGVQAQNFPKRILIGRDASGKSIYSDVGARECLRAALSDDYVFVCGDLPTAELRSVGQRCLDWFGWSKLADAINAGRDVHKELGGKIAGVSYEDMVARAHEPEIKAARDNAKPGNFGLWGMMRERGYQAYAWKNYRIRLTLEQAQQHIRYWEESWPENTLYFDKVRSMLGTDRSVWVERSDGTKESVQSALAWSPATGRYRGRVIGTQLANYFFQEPTATGAAAGACEVQRRCWSDRRSAMYGVSWLIMYTHDECVLACRRDMVHDVACELGAVMAERFNQYHDRVPIKKVDVVATEVYSKKAEAVYGPDGRLGIWTA